MGRHRIRFGVIMDIVFTNFQLVIKNGISRYLESVDVDAVYMGIGNLDANDVQNKARSRLLGLISETEFDGLIIVSTSLSNSGGRSLLEEKLRTFKKIPMVSIGPSLIGEEELLFDNNAGMLKLMDHLINDHSYRRFAYVSGPLGNPESMQRLKAYRKALDDHRIPHTREEEFEGNFISISGVKAVEVFLDERKLKPEVIVCANDWMAMGVWNELQARGINIPHDIAVTGYDDSRIGYTLSTCFTTVRQSLDLLGYRAAQRLHSLVSSGITEKPELPVPALKIRSSCGCVEYPKRKTTDGAEAIDEDILKIRSAVDELREKGFPGSEIGDLYRTWENVVRERLNSMQPTYDLEELLQESIQQAKGESGGQRDEQVFLNMYLSLLEEYNHTMVANDWEDSFANHFLRLAIDRVQTEMMKNQEFSAGKKVFENLAEACKAARFHLVRYDDVSDISDGGTVVYSTTVDSKWNPKPGSWLPDEDGSLTFNLLTDGEKVYGYIMVDADIQKPAFFEELRIRFNAINVELSAMENIMSMNLKLQKEISERERAEDKLKDALALVHDLSIRDQLTGLHNRRGFLALAEQQMLVHKRKKRQFGILYIDLDGLKVINDRLGHKEGDLAIMTAAQVLEDVLRESDILARLGGDEFVAMLSECDQEGLISIIERIHTVCSEKSLENNHGWDLSMSIGYHLADPDSNQALQMLLEKADKSMYMDKNRKRKHSE